MASSPAKVPTSVDSHLEISPDKQIDFLLSADDPTTKVTMTLKHPDKASSPVAFKVKTTQPRRYLVRPNQGLIQPGQSETVQILLVEKDKKNLLQSYESMGAAALQHSKDKFLVQSVAVTSQEAETLGAYDALTALWSRLQGSSASIANQKLAVKHTVAAGGATAAPLAAARAEQPNVDPSSLSKEQLITELNSLRHKYDELVAFSVNLTAERDILNNTLEQTKRDLNRQVNKTAAGGGGRSSLASPPAKSSGSSTLVTMILIVLCLLGGAKLQQAGVMESIPVIGDQFGTTNTEEQENGFRGEL